MINPVLTEAAIAAAREIFNDQRTGHKTFDAMALWMTRWMRERGVFCRVEWSGTPGTWLNFCFVDLEPIHEVNFVAEIEF